MSQPCALIMAGGTGGHIFPGLAIAKVLHHQGWRVHWLGAPDSMEDEHVNAHRVAVFEPVAFSGLRGKGWRSWLSLPARLLRALWQSYRVLRRVKPDVVLGFGGYISFPGGLLSVLLRKPLLLHEQNAIAGMANRVLAKWATEVFTTYPNALPRGQWVGNPLRRHFLQLPPPAERFAHRRGRLRLVVMGGSLGAQAINQIVPRALALVSWPALPSVVHQSGKDKVYDVYHEYTSNGVPVRATDFIENVAFAIADADVVIARAGASTVAELAAVGVAAILVPYPHAVDDHQTHNARYLSDAGAAWLLPQDQLEAESFAAFFETLTREELLTRAQRAHALAKTEAVASIVQACRRQAGVPPLEGGQTPRVKHPTDTGDAA